MSRARDFADLAGSADAGGLTGRNLIINGAMQVAQRGTSFDAAQQYLCDRWRFGRQTDGYDLTWAQSTTAPDGFGNSLKLDVTTADTSLNADVFALVQQRVEGKNLQMLKKGTSAAESVTVSFYVRSAKTGTYILELIDKDNSDRHINKSYTINSADTWEYKSITFEGDTTGAFDNDANRSLDINWWLASGSDRNSGTLATSWQAFDDTDRAVGQVNIFDSTSNDWYITGVQMEVGEKATPFEHRSFGDELQRCQRYFFAQQALAGEDYYAFGMGAAENSGTFRGLSSFPVTMRIEPSLTATASNTFFTQGFTPASNTVTLDQSGRDCAYCTVFGSGGTAGYAGRWLADNTDAAYLFWSAEL